MGTNIKVKVAFGENEDETFAFEIDSDNIFKPNFTIVDGKVQAGGRDLQIGQFQTLMTVIISLKKWIENYDVLKIEIERDDP